MELSSGDNGHRELLVSQRWARPHRFLALSRPSQPTPGAIYEQKLLSIVSNEIREVGLDPQLQLDVFEQIATITFGYIDFLSQQVVATYQGEREHWLESRNRMRAERVREVLDEAVIDVDAVTKEIRYPLSRTHLALVLWFPSDEATGNELGRLKRFVRELTESMETLGAPLFVAADRVPCGRGFRWAPTRPAMSPSKFVDSPDRILTRPASPLTHRCRVSRDSGTRIGRPCTGGLLRWRAGERRHCSTSPDPPSTAPSQPWKLFLRNAAADNTLSYLQLRQHREPPNADPQ